MYKLLTRDCFREEVFKRDNYTCVVCKVKGVTCNAHWKFKKIIPNKLKENI